MDRYDYIESIYIFIKGITGINYQLQLKQILKAYYKYKGKTFEMPDYYGGDQKNDGWVIEDAIFYQIFAPTRLKDALKTEIQNKFESDLRGLLDLVYNEGKWNGEVKEFIFIVNTFDCNLPNDSERFYEQLAIELKQKYKIDFKYKIENSEYLKEILSEINEIEILKKISAALHIKGMIDFNAITETIIMDLIIDISAKLNEKFMEVKNTDTYTRVSSVKKIEINDLDTNREEIESIISKLDVVERAINVINQDILYEDKFERVKCFIVTKYEELSITIQGKELYDLLIKEMLSYANNPHMLQIPIKFLIIYIFDKCDIFEKE